ncbi:MAG: hypothetical protein IKV90_00730, partial [Clostridia bacterium]|nr:hypothetical protein [Clostridia bacterium]
QEALHLAGAVNGQLILFGKLVHTHDCDDILQFLIALEDLLYITPGETLLLELCGRQKAEIAVCWESPLFATMALCERLLGEAPLELDEGAGQLLMETVRLLWQPEEKVLAGLPALRARIAVRLREGKRSGLHEAGRLLCGWLEENEQ